MWVAKTMRMGRESLYPQLLLAKRTISLDNLIATNRIAALLNGLVTFRRLYSKKHLVALCCTRPGVENLWLTSGFFDNSIWLFCCQA